MFYSSFIFLQLSLQTLSLSFIDNASRLELASTFSPAVLPLSTVFSILLLLWCFHSTSWTYLNSFWQKPCIQSPHSPTTLLSTFFSQNPFAFDLSQTWLLSQRLLLTLSLSLSLSLARAQILKYVHNRRLPRQCKLRWNTQQCGNTMQYQYHQYHQYPPFVPIIPHPFTICTYYISVRSVSCEAILWMRTCQVLSFEAAMWVNSWMQWLGGSHCESRETCRVTIDHHWKISWILMIPVDFP